MEPSRPIFTVEPPQRPVPQPPKRKPGGILGGIIAIGVVLFKFAAPILLFLKTGLTMLLSIGAYSLLFNWTWQFATGFVVLIFVHEMGHFFAAKCYRVPVSAPVFIPLVGAYVLTKNHPLDYWTNAVISYAGPLAGGLGGWACYLLGLEMDLDWMINVAFWTFVLNLVNLLPVPPLDGSRVWIIFSASRTPGVIFSDRVYMGLFLAGLIAGLLLGCLKGWLYFHGAY